MKRLHAVAAGLLLARAPEGDPAGGGGGAPEHKEGDAACKCAACSKARSEAASAMATARHAEEKAAKEREARFADMETVNAVEKRLTDRIDAIAPAKPGAPAQAAQSRTGLVVGVIIGAVLLLAAGAVALLRAKPELARVIPFPNRRTA